MFRSGATLLCLVLVSAFLGGCETTGPGAPPVTAEMAKAGGGRSQLSLATLQEGRTLFVARCVECHVLPRPSGYSREKWPGIVHEMAERASLKPAQSNAVLAYILAARGK